MTIGLLGGSFNPPHAAHLKLSLFALKRLRLDAVWWLVTPGNPLKPHRGLPSLATRIAAARALAHHPRIVVTGIEEALGTRFTIDTVRELKRRCPGVRFVWLMGADNLASFHRWRSWRAIAAALPLAVVDRAGATLRATASPAATTLRPWRRREAAAGLLGGSGPPAWIYLFGMKSPLSSTMLRARKLAKGGGRSG